MHAIGRSKSYPLFMRPAAYTNAYDEFFDENISPCPQVCEVFIG